VVSGLFIVSVVVGDGRSQEPGVSVGVDDGRLAGT
jgi:hypothetical protein